MIIRLRSAHLLFELHQQLQPRIYQVGNDGELFFLKLDPNNYAAVTMYVNAGAYLSLFHNFCQFCKCFQLKIFLC